MKEEIKNKKENIKPLSADVNPKINKKDLKSLEQVPRKCLKGVEEKAKDFKNEAKKEISSIIENYDIDPSEIQIMQEEIEKINQEVNGLVKQTKQEVAKALDVDPKELESFIKEKKQADLERLVNKIKQEKQEFLKTQKENQVRIEKIRQAIKDKTKKLDLLKKELRKTQENINKKSNSLITRLFRKQEIKMLKGFYESDSRKIEKINNELEDLLFFKKDLNDQLEQKIDVNKLEQEVESFYNANIDDFKAEQEKQRLERLEREEMEEKERQVNNITEKYGVTFIHSIKDNFVPGSNSILKKGVDFETKLKLALSLEPTLSTSTIKKGSRPENMWGTAGLILNNGRVEDAHSRDGATQAKSLHKRESHNKNKPKDISSAVKGEHSGYNELVVARPGFAGMYITAKETALSNQEVSKEQFFKTAEKINMPTFLIEKGEIFKVSWDKEKKQIIKGEKVDQKEIKENKKVFTKEEKQKMFNDVAKEQLPFRVEQIIPDARKVQSKNEGAKEYIDLMANSSVDFKAGQVINGQDIGIDVDKKDHNGERILKGDKIRLLKEIVNVDGSVERYFENNGKIYKQKEFDKALARSRSDNNLKKFSLVDRDEDSYIKIHTASCSLTELNKQLRNINDYLDGVGSYIDKLKKDFIKYKDDPEMRDYIKENKAVLAFHLYGFAESAEKFGDLEASKQANQLAQELLPREKYQEIIEKRINENGKFKITSKDLE